MEYEEKIYNEAETVIRFTYLGVMVNVGGGCMAVGTTCGSVSYTWGML